ncbi:MAG: aminopeptidase P family protein [Saprospiraceae bacterium]|nr:aminopeptidase P family protein [Saprospiraceae bacterium]
MNIPDRVEALRRQMTEQQVDAYIIPSSDPHQSEYVAEHWSSRFWISGFSGSAGLVVITAHHAGLWTDSRYFIQAEKELEGTGIELHRLGVPHTPEHIAWITQNLSPSAIVAVDGSLFSVKQIRHLQKAFDKKGIHLEFTLDLISPIWKKRPPRPLYPVSELNETFTGLSRREKMDRTRSEMKRLNADLYLISTLDDVAWLWSLRGKDVDFNPVFVAYMVLDQTLGHLFIDGGKLNESITKRLELDGIKIWSYDYILTFLSNRKNSDAVLLDYATTQILQFQALNHTTIIPGRNLIEPLKAQKNESEIRHLKSAMQKDGIALVQFYRWLEHAIAKNEAPTEYEIAEKLAFFRRQQEFYQGESFSAIVGFKGNGAIVHYRPDKHKSAPLQGEGMLLIDSGGQYLDGTTDITRTTFIGTPSSQHKRHYTLVLQGHIALSQQVFPAGTTGVQLDILARQYLWQEGLNYGHGTGHGVGCFLNVHEGPQSISPNPRSSKTQQPFLPGMITSNEPGFYVTDTYGIRIENLVVCYEKEQSPFGNFLAFEPITLFPIDTQLIEISLLSAAQINWINNYHDKVYSELSKWLNNEEKAWLANRCQHI